MIKAEIDELKQTIKKIEILFVVGNLLNKNGVNPPIIPDTKKIIAYEKALNLVLKISEMIIYDKMVVMNTTSLMIQIKIN